MKHDPNMNPHCLDDVEPVGVIAEVLFIVGAIAGCMVLIAILIGVSYA